MVAGCGAAAPTNDESAARRATRGLRAACPWVSRRRDDAGPTEDAAPPATCLVTATDTSAASLGKATTAGEYQLTIEAASASKDVVGREGQRGWPSCSEVLRGQSA